MTLVIIQGQEPCKQESSCSVLLPVVSLPLAAEAELRQSLSRVQEPQGAIAVCMPLPMLTLCASRHRLGFEETRRSRTRYRMPHECTARSPATTGHYLVPTTSVRHSRKHTCSPIHQCTHQLAQCVQQERGPPLFRGRPCLV